ncbi:MAG: isoprenylcysteine carboxylmethyltransferase family protein [bacterium]
MQKDNNKPKNILMVIRILASLLIFFMLIFGSAGRLDYWQGWIYYSIYLGFIGIFLYKYITDTAFKDLVKERMKPGPGTKWWDKIFYIMYIPFSMITIFLSVLDAGRFDWALKVPISIYIISCILYILSIGFVSWAMWTNRFFSSMVRIQTDRGHQVIQTGPYQYLRHPGYAGAIVWWLTTPLVLGSILGCIPTSIIILGFIIRTVLEDRTLQKELPGYQEYTQKVKYRLFPKIW